MRASLPYALVLVLMLGACTQTEHFDIATPSAPDGAVPPPPTDAPACGSLRDADNCGACGHSCFGGQCTAALLCTAVEVAGNLRSSERLSIAADSSALYWADYDGVKRLAKSGGKPTLLTHGYNSFGYGPRDIALTESDVFFNNLYGGTVWRIAKTGGAPALVYDEGRTSEAIPDPLSPLAADDTTVYWGHFGGGLYACPHAGCPSGPRAFNEPKDIVSMRFGESALVYTAGYGAGASVRAFDTKSGTTRDLAPATDGDDALAAEGQTAYVLGTGGFIRSLPIAPHAGAPVAIATGAHLSAEIAVDDEYVYWPDGKHPSSIFRSSRDGSGLPELVVGDVPRRVFGISVDEHFVYFSVPSDVSEYGVASANGAIMRVAKPASRDAR